MLAMTHLDGSDVVIIDDRGHQVPAVEVRLEPGLAVVSVDRTAQAWLRELRTRNANETLAGAVHSASDGHVHHGGAFRVVYV